MGTRKLSFIKEFLQLQNDGIIISLEKLLIKKKLKIIEDGMKPMSLKKFYADIDQ
jgi:hypothetical protein